MIGNDETNLLRNVLLNNRQVVSPYEALVNSSSKDIKFLKRLNYLKQYSKVNSLKSRFGIDEERINAVGQELVDTIRVNGSSISIQCRNS